MPSASRCSWSPIGSCCVELGDTYSGGVTEQRGGWSDAPQDGASERSTKFERISNGTGSGIRNLNGKKQPSGNGWPLAKSLSGTPTLAEIEQGRG